MAILPLSKHLMTRMKLKRMAALFMISVVLPLCSLSAQQSYESGITIPEQKTAMLIDSTELSVQIAESFDINKYREYITALAADSMGGRELGSSEVDKAANYIQNHLVDFGYASMTGDDLYQDVEFYITNWRKNLVQINDVAYKHMWDYLVFHDETKEFEGEIDEVLYLGYGIEDGEYNDYRKNSVQGKTILIQDGYPVKNGKLVVLEEEWTINKRIETAYRHGASMVLILEDNIQKLLMDNRAKVLNRGAKIRSNSSTTGLVPHIYISSNMAQNIFGDELKSISKARKKASRKRGLKKPVHLPLNASIELVVNRKDITGQNIYAYLPSAKQTDETVIISAHYDHVGKSGVEIFNGADDNASGSSLLIEMARIFKEMSDKGHTLDRNVLFLWLTGEEKGLLGSYYYVNNPLVPIENSIANVNIDMIGRIDTKYVDQEDYIYVIGADRLSQDLHDLNEEINEKYTRMTLDYTYNNPNDPNRYYERSDHYNFADKGIPAVFFFSGVHEDYHRPTDTVDKINFDKVSMLANHIAHLIYGLSSMDNNIRLNSNP